MKMVVGNYAYVTGKVTEMQVGEKTATATIASKRWDSEMKEEVDVTYKVTFFNNDKQNFTERFAKLDLTGRKVTVKCFEKDEKLTGYDFALTGGTLYAPYTNKQDEKKHLNIYFGRVLTHDNKLVESEKGKRYTVSIGINRNIDGDKFTEWVSVTFWNENAEKAAKALRDKAIVVLKMSDITEYVGKDEKERKRASGYDFRVFEYPSKGNASAPSENEDDFEEYKPEQKSTAASVFGDLSDDDDDDDYCF